MEPTISVEKPTHPTGNSGDLWVEFLMTVHNNDVHHQLNFYIQARSMIEHCRILKVLEEYRKTVYDSQFHNDDACIMESLGVVNMKLTGLRRGLWTYYSLYI
ncbi:hypothetical protein C0J52_11692 [Blattella germanica]|nr:hypothetical protein C0J52_11692 [Blattella germanica]